MIALSSEFEDGSCFIETAELDGETNLKRRSAIPETMALNTIESISHFCGLVECEPPNENLNTYSGRIILPNSISSSSNLGPHSSHHPASPIHDSHDPSFAPLTTLASSSLPASYSPSNSKTHILSMNQFIPRGSVLRNTQFIYGIVIYAGKDTKIMRNLKSGKLKFSTLESKLNRLILGVFVYNLFLIVSSVILEYVNWNFIRTRAVGYYIDTNYANGSVGASHVGTTIISFFVLYTYVIPISLFVTMEIVRFLQAQWMMWDEKMMIVSLNKSGKKVSDYMKANNSNLNEDLGAIEYIFTDKTGTLTQNLMTMSNWWIDGVDYNEMEKPGCLKKTIMVRLERKIKRNIEVMEDEGRKK